MIGEKRVLALITARGGSQRLPGKNLMPLSGKPLIAWSIEAAHGSALVDRTVLSSDDTDIIAVAREWGCDVPFVRPAELATDRASSIDVMLHAMQAVEAEGDRFDYLVLLQPTSPLRASEDIDACLRMCADQEAPAVVAICELEHGPHLMLRREDDGSIQPLLPEFPSTTRSQDVPPAYLINGAVYVVDWEKFKKNRVIMSAGTLGWVMPQERSVDIDKSLDMTLAGALLNISG